jgi:N-acetylmuramic acid 6-phosphate (MurNAc-6-P) etherase
MLTGANEDIKDIDAIFQHKDKELEHMLIKDILGPLEDADKEINEDLIEAKKEIIAALNAVVSEFNDNS